MKIIEKNIFPTIHGLFLYNRTVAVPCPNIYIRSQTEHE